MVESSRLQKLLTSLQQYLSKSGVTSKSKWMLFSPHHEMSPVEFTRRLNQIGISITAKETLALWKAVKIDSKFLTFDDFLKFLTTDASSLTSDPPAPISTIAPRPFTLWSVFNSNRRALLVKLGEFDPLTTGHISIVHFKLICDWLRPSSDPTIVDIILSVYDTDSNGSFNYFTLLSDICELPDPPPTRPLPPISDTDTDTDKPSRPAILDRHLIRQLDNTTAISRGGRGLLDPAIFGPRPRVDPPPTANLTSADDVIGAKPFAGFGKLDLLSAIPKFIFKCAKSNRECYQRWRGAHELLTASDLRDGLARDAKVLVPLYDLEVLIEEYGGPMRLCAFVRMVSDGNRSEEKPTDDEAALNGIARKVRGEKWSGILYRSSCVEEIVLGFEQEGIEVEEDEIRLLTSKLGRIGLISAIHVRLEQLKKD